MNTVLQKLAVLAVTLFTCLWASAADAFYTGGIYYNITDPTAKTVEVTSSENGYSGDIVVPSTVTYNNKTYTVTTIGNEAFNSCEGLTSITLPNSLTTIGNYTFAGCDGLTSITLPNSVTAIGELAFAYCYSLTSITSHAVTPPGCGDYAFDGVDKQKCAIFVPAESIDAYKQATGWKDFAYIDEIGAVRNFEVDGIYYNVTDPTAKEVEVIKGENAYSGDITVPSTVTYNNKTYTVTTIGYEVFRDCDGLTSITLPNSMTTIGNYAFWDCDGLISVTLPNSVTTIGNDAFRYCNGLTSITLPNSVTTIGERAFFNCNGLTSITLPSSVTTIGNKAFAACYGLTCIEVDSDNQMYSSVDGILYDKAQTSLIQCPAGKTGDVIIPSTVTSIGVGAFNGCSGLTSITSNAVTPPGGNSYAFDRVDKQKCAIFVPAESIDAYKQAEGWKDFAFIDEIGAVRSFEVNGIYYNVTDKTTMEVEVIKGENAYSGDITVPSTVTYNNTQYSVTAIGNQAFSGCSGLTSITLPNSVTAIGNQAFSGCSGLTSITLPNSVTTIGERAFYSCYRLTSITLPNSVTIIGEQAFDSCDGLTSITLPNSVTTIGIGAFLNCDGLTSITSNAVTPPGCGRYAFYSIDKQKCFLFVPAESIDAYKQAEGWKDFAFIDEIGTVRNFEVDGIYYNVTDKTTMEVEVIKGENAYSGDITVPSTVTYNNKTYTVTAIGDEAFISCYSLTSVTLPNSVTTIGNQAFAHCSGLTSITSHAVTPPGCNDYTFNGVDKQKCAIFVPAESVEAYKQAEGWKNFTFIDEIGAIRSFEVDGIYYNVTDKTTMEVEVIKGENAYSGDITVPSTVTYNNKTYTVTAIGDEAFISCYSLTSVTLPNSVTTIGNQAFHYCLSLNSITLPNSVTTIGDEAFYYCRGLNSITLPNSVTTIGERAFFNSNGPTSITLPNSVTTIGNQAFHYCLSLNSITLPNSVTTIGERAFFNSNGLTSITLPNSVTTIGEGAFWGCSGLTSITLPSSVTTIGNYAFYNCSGLTCINVDSDNQMYSSIDGILYDKAQTSLICCPGGKTEDVIVPNTVTSICNYAFYGCRGLTSITLPNSVTSIGYEAFANCRSLTSIDVDSDNQKYSSVDGILYDKAQTSLICCPGGKTEDVIVPNTVTSIGDYAFASCKGLNSVTLPSSVTTIGEGAFASCDDLFSITSHAATPPECGDFAFNGVDKQKCAIFVPAESIDAYKQATEWKYFALIDEIGAVRIFEVDGIRYIVPDKTAKEVEVTSRNKGYSGSIVVPSTVTYNNEQYSVTAIGDEAFASCYGLTSITLPNSVTAIGERAFEDCSGLTSITLPNSVTTIGNAAFTDCTGLTSITLPNSVTAIGNDAFAECSGLTSITLPNSVTTIGDYAFFNCDGLTSVTLPNSVTTIGNEAFANCRSLTSIDVDSDNQKYSSVDGILYDKAQTSLIQCPAGKTGDVIVPNTVTTIYDYAFTYCSGLNSITLPNSVTTIGYEAFYGCDNLISITSHAVTPPRCSYNTFNGVSMQKCFLFVPAESIDAYKQAEGWKDFAFIDEIGAVRIFEVDGIRYIVTDKTAKEVEVTSRNNGYSGNIVVPSTVTYNNEQYTVTAIGYEAFANCDGLTSITLPKSVTAIRDYAFIGCDGLTSITLPNSVTTIGEWAFSQCSGLTSIDVDSDNQKYSSVDGILYDKAQTSLIQCPGGKNGDVIVPNTVTTICDNAFAWCPGLTSVNLPSSVKIIGFGAFYLCRSLTSIILPSSVTAIGNYAFAGCSGLTSITSLAIVPPVCYIYTFDGVDVKNCPLYVPAESVDAYKQAPVWEDFYTIESASRFFEVDGIYYYIIDPTTNTVEVTSGGNEYSGNIVVPSTVTYNNELYTVTAIGDEAFRGCRKLISITLPSSVTTIGERAFDSCSRMTSIDVDAANQAYSSIDGILYDKAQTRLIKCPEGRTREVIIPSTVTAIGDYAFAGCNGLTSITSFAVTPPECGTSAFDGVDVENCTLYVPAESVDAYKQAPVWEDFYTIEEAKPSDIDSVGAGSATNVEVFNIKGVKVSDTLENLPAGVYIVRNGSTSRKVVVR